MLLLALSIIFFAESPPYYRGLVISEVVSGAEHDWVELMFTDTSREKIEISSLHVSMFYGTSEPLSSEPVSIYSRNRPETPYDDRFVVVYPARPGIPDETDRTGDTNRNGIIELYCNNYHASFWNTDCVVGLSTGGSISGGGLIDFVAYSTRQGEFNRNMLNNMSAAAEASEWVIYDMNAPALSAVDIGPSGLSAFESISRRPGPDTNTLNDFYVTKYQTPGRENIETVTHKRNALIRTEKSRITVIPGERARSQAVIGFTVFELSQVKIRIFSSDGRMVHQGRIIRDLTPGVHSYTWNPGRHPSGIYICRIEAVDRKMQTSQSKTIMIIVSRYR